MKIFPALMAILLASQISHAAINPESLTRSMTLREKVGQLFIIRPDQLDPSLSPDQVHDPRKFGVKSFTPSMRQTLTEYPAGGFAFFGKNIESPKQLKKYTS
ncbi:MAG: hypothetical protein IJG36_11060, partial [Synergistaceae bacterium]|nr:hypothetical protein [Synergistaceae bacterium]